MFFRQIYEDGLAQASYIVGSTEAEEAIVVDPRRDIDVYLRVAQDNDLKITAVTETHIHADFLSGARDLAAMTGATLCVSGEGEADWRYRGLPPGSRELSDGDIIRAGNVNLGVLHTPGHTPEHVTFIVSEGRRPKVPMIAIAGDFVFVGDVGRPDLLESAVGVAGSADAGARTMFASLRDKFCPLPDFVQIWPGHGAGSACGKALGAVPASTVGYEKLTAWWAPLVDAGDVEGFARELLDGQPDAPRYFARMKRLNRDGPPPLLGVPHAKRLNAAGLRDAIGSGAQVIDTRERRDFRAGHVAGALSIADEPTFATRAAWFASEQTPIALIARPNRVDGLVRALVRVGLDRLAGFVSQDEHATLRSLPSATLDTVDVSTARAEFERGRAFVLDVRTNAEYRQGHIPGALHVPASRIATAIGALPRNRPLLVHCAGGGRSNAVASVLLANGFADVRDVVGGFDAWCAAGNPIETGDQIATPVDA